MYKELAITTIATAVLVYSFPQYLTTERISRSVVRFGIIDFFLFSFWRVLIWPFFFSPLRHLPGPTSYNLLIGNAASQFNKPPGEQMRIWFEDIPNEGLLRFRSFFNLERLVVTNPEALKSILSDNSYDFEKPEGVRRFLGRILGNGLIMAEGGLHKFQRKHLLPAFQVQHIRGLYPIFWDKSKELVQAITTEIAEEKGTVKSSSGMESEKGIGLAPVIEFGEWSTRVTLDIIGRAGLGCDFNCVQNTQDELVRDYNSLLEPSLRRKIFYIFNIFGPQDLINSLPFAQTIELRRITTNLRKFCIDQVRQRRLEQAKSEKSTDTDILSLLIRSNDFSDDDLVDQCLTFLAAGHETTSSALTWAVHLLATHKDWQERLRAEIRANLSPLSNTQPPSYTEIENLPILNAICSETLRFFPVVPMSIRMSVRPTTISVSGKQQPISAGTRVLIVPWAINRCEKFWGPDANKFTPERWMQPGTANTGGVENNYANMTFFHGPRSCIGQGFSKAEFKCLLAALVGAMRWEMADEDEVVIPSGVVTTKPNKGMKVRMERVEGW